MVQNDLGIDVLRGRQALQTTFAHVFRLVWKGAMHWAQAGDSSNRAFNYASAMMNFVPSRIAVATRPPRSAK